MNIELVQLEPRRILGVRDVVTTSDLMEFFPQAFDSVVTEMEEKGIEAVGPPIALYHGDLTDTVDVTAGFPVASQVVPTARSIVATLPGGTAIETIHNGLYDTISETYAQLAAWLTERKLTPAGDVWEEYLVGPETDPNPVAWQTRIVLRVA